MYKATPTAKRFHASAAWIKGLQGPMGCGKTTACAHEVWRHVGRIEPQQGERRARWAFVAQEPDIVAGDMFRTFEQMAPDGVQVCRTETGASVTRREQTENGEITLDLEVVFLAWELAWTEPWLRRPNPDTDRWLKLALSGVWIDGADTMPYPLPQQLLVRTGRCNYPYCKPLFLVSVTKPEPEHWWCTFFCHQKGAEAFRYPPAVLGKWSREHKPVWAINPKAENLRNLPDEYYEHLLADWFDSKISHYLAL